MKILLIDNYDSFTYNLLHLVERVTGKGSVDLVYNDRIDNSLARTYNAIIISPGPGIPSEAGGVLEMNRSLASSIPILGICLGHQAIAEAFGGTVFRMEKPLHGIKDRLAIKDNSRIFKGIGTVIDAGRYHSWLVSSHRLPDCLEVTATDGDDRIMAISHRDYHTHGIQFHPESYMTGCGENHRKFYKKE